MSQSIYPRWHYVIFYIVLIATLGVMIAHEWVAEDAFITFRVVDNFVHGFGLRWNVDERVQTYSNPLWMLLHIPFYAVWPHIEFIDIALSLACVITSVLLILRTFDFAPLQAVICLLLPLSLSKTLTEYFSSGLENPLSLLLFACFGAMVKRPSSPKRLFLLTLIVALSMVNRLDNIIAYIPIMLWILWSEFRLHWRWCIAGTVPILGWLSFSLFYYGFLLPNTKYAKLDAGIDVWQYLKVGIYYLADFVFADPVMVGVLAVVSGQTIYQWRSAYVKGGLLNHASLLILGIFAYCTYVVWVGGNQVSCRFLSLPVFMALWVFQMKFCPQIQSLKALAFTGTAIILIYGCTMLPSWQHAHERIAQTYDVHPTSRADYLIISQKNGTFRLNTFEHVPSVCPADNHNIQILEGIGHLGYFGGPCQHIIDPLGLGDPLLARLPPASSIISRIGHLRRDIPTGYVHALETGSLNLMHPALAHYYDPLRTITTSTLRIAAIPIICMLTENLE